VTLEEARAAIGKAVVYNPCGCAAANQRTVIVSVQDGLALIRLPWVSEEQAVPCRDLRPAEFSPGEQS
jgi:hypothetical protein